MLTRLTRLLTGIAVMTTGEVLYQLSEKNVAQNNLENQNDALDLRGQDCLVGPKKTATFPSEGLNHRQPTCVAISHNMYGSLTLFTQQGKDSRKIMVTEGSHESMIQCLKEKLNLLPEHNLEKYSTHLANIIQLFSNSCDNEMRIWCDKHLTFEGKKEFAKIIARIQVAAFFFSQEKLPLGSGGVMLKTMPGRSGKSIMIGFDLGKKYDTHDMQQAANNLINTIENLLPKDNTLFLSDGISATKGRTQPGYINRQV